jgi:hypothetical protein
MRTVKVPNIQRTLVLLVAMLALSAASVGADEGLVAANETGGTLWDEWNLVSLPVDPLDDRPRAVFDEVGDPLFLCTYNTAAEAFSWVDKPASAAGTAGTLTEVGPLGGYWVAVRDASQVPEFGVSGSPLTGEQAIDLPDAGWHMVGVPYDVEWRTGSGSSISVTYGTQTVSLEQAIANGWIYKTIWEWDAATQEWITTTVSVGTTLDPWKGYWIYTNVSDLVLNLFWESAGPLPPPPPSPPSSALHMPLEIKNPGNPPKPCMRLDTSQVLKVMNIPNPIQDVHTTTFWVKGALEAFVEAIKVRIFDLAGRPVYESDWGENGLDWHVKNLQGEILANGVYLYQVYVRIEGVDEPIVSGVEKLAVYR